VFSQGSNRSVTGDVAPDVTPQFLAFLYILEVACSDNMPKTRFPDRASLWHP